MSPSSYGNNADAVSSAETQNGSLPIDYILNGCASESYDHSDESVVGVYGCVVVSDRDNDFGHLQSVESTPEYIDSSSVKILASQCVDFDSLSHLTPIQLSQLLNLLDRFRSCFSVTPGFCPLVEHHMEMSPDFRPKCFKAYGVPEKLNTLYLHKLKNCCITASLSPVIAHRLAQLYNEGSNSK
jgi:hypothetical protein